MHQKVRCYIWMFLYACTYTYNSVYIIKNRTTRGTVSHAVITFGNEDGSAWDAKRL